MNKRRKSAVNLDFMEQAISGPVTTQEQKNIVAVVKRWLHKIKRSVLG